MKTLLAKLLGISRNLLEWLWPIVARGAGDALEVLLPIALGIVTRLALDKTMTNPEKRDVAAKELTQAAIAYGVPAGLSVVNLAVEMAVAKLKAEAGK